MNKRPFIRNIISENNILLARIISIIFRGGIVFDIYFLVGIFPEFIIAPFFFFLRNKVFKS